MQEGEKLSALTKQVDDTAENKTTSGILSQPYCMHSFFNGNTQLTTVDRDTVEILPKSESDLLKPRLNRFFSYFNSIWYVSEISSVLQHSPTVQ